MKKVRGKEKIDTTKWRRCPAPKGTAVNHIRLDTEGNWWYRAEDPANDALEMPAPRMNKGV